MLSVGRATVSGMTITAAADGSALGNPGPAGWAWYIDDSNWRSGGWPHGTNNMGELHAVLDLLQSTQDLGEPLRVLCDSQYVINSITKWMKGWMRLAALSVEGTTIVRKPIVLEGCTVKRKLFLELIEVNEGERIERRFAVVDRVRVDCRCEH